MILQSFFKEKKEEVCMLINIGNSNVTGALATFKKGERPKFLKTSKISFPVVDTLTEKRLVLGMTESLDALFLGLLGNKSSKGSFAVSHVLISFSSPWFTLKATDLELTEPKPFLVTKSLIQQILSKQEKIFQKELLELGAKEEDFSVIEKQAVHIRLNGYETQDIVGKKTSELGLSICMSATPSFIMNKVQGVISKHLHLPEEHITTHSFPTVFFSAIRDEFSSDSDFILMDITGEMTDLVLVRDSAIKKIVSFPFGKNFLVRQIYKRFNVSMEIAESTLNMYIQKRTSDLITKKLEMIVEDTEKEWSIYLEDALLTLSPDLALPKKLHMRANSDTAPLFLEFLKIQKNDKTGIFRKGLVVEHLSRDSMKGKYEVPPNIQVSEISIILAMFHQKQDFS